MTDTGILFFSHLPRDMRPTEIREVFQRFGPTFRQKFVAAETNNKKSQVLRKKAGKNKVLQFKEGWLEYNNFKDAKEAATQMNSQPVDVKNTRRAAGEMWTCKVLPRGYRWEDLVTEMEGEKRMRRIKIQAELQREKEINEAYRTLAMKELSRRKRHDDGDYEEDNQKAGVASKSSKKENNNDEDGNGEHVLNATDFVKEANSIPGQLMKIKRKKKQEAKKASREESEGSAVAGKKNAFNKNNSSSAISSTNRIAKKYTNDGYRDLYNA